MSDYETIIYLFTQYGKLFHLSQQEIENMEMDFFFDQMIVIEKESMNKQNNHARAIEDMGF